MKYLFDTLTKNGLTLAKLYKYIKEGDEFKVYDPEVVPVEGFDVRLLGCLEKATESSPLIIPGVTESDFQKVDGVMTYVKTIDDSRQMLSTLDFDKALDWCDEYVCMVNTGEVLLSTPDSEKAYAKIQAVFDRMMKTMEKGKKVYLGNLENSEYQKIAKEYENFDKSSILDEESFNEIKQYKDGYFLDSENAINDVTLVIGTSSASGKMSSCFKMKESYEKTNQDVCMILTEEIAPFLDQEKYKIYPFMQTNSTLTFEEECEYLRCLIGKIRGADHPHHIMIVSQGAFSIFDGAGSTRKPLGVISNLLWSNIGCESVVINSSYRYMSRVEELIRFCRLTHTNIDMVNVSPLEAVKSNIFYKDLKIGDVTFKVNDITDAESLLPQLVGFMAEWPEVPLTCDYMGITDKLNEYMKTDEFLSIYKSMQAFKMIQKLQENKDALFEKTGNVAYNFAIGNQIDLETVDETLIDKDMLTKVKELLKNKML